MLQLRSTFCSYKNSLLIVKVSLLTIILYSSEVKCGYILSVHDVAKVKKTQEFHGVPDVNFYLNLTKFNYLSFISFSQQFS
ncbi:hypothetical protein AT1219_10118 [Vibrio alginolyticus]